MCNNSMMSVVSDNDVKNQIERVVLPSYVKRNLYNCYEQQIFTLCQLYRGEFWRLFLNQSILHLDDSDGSLENSYKIRGNITSSAANKYGIYMEEIHDFRDIVFNDDHNLYLAEIDSNIYEFTKDLEEQGTHYLIIYGEDGDNYLVNDNYYGMPSQMIDKTVLNDGLVRIYRVNHEEKFKIMDLDGFQTIFSTNILDEYKKICKSLDNEKCDDSNQLIEFLTEIYKYCNKVAVVIRNVKDNRKMEYINACAKEVEIQVKHIQNSVYAVIKKVIRNVVFDYDLTKEILMEQENKVAIVQNVLNEMNNMVSGKACIAERLIGLLKNYEDTCEGEISIKQNDSAYILHDKLTILLLLNYLEEMNTGININYEDIIDCDTYRDFLIVAYRKILENNRC